MKYSIKLKYYVQHYNKDGFSLIELIISIAIMAILIGISVPSFTSIIARNNVVTQTNTIFESLYLARSYAITQQKNVHVCHMSKPDSLECHQQRDYNTAWSNGWLIFADVNNTNEYDDGDNLIRAFQASERANIVFNQQGRLRFFPDGSARSAGFYVCDKQQKNYRHVYLLHSGRARANETITAQQKSHCDNA